jgi:predicted transcriptional regulator
MEEIKEAIKKYNNELNIMKDNLSNDFNHLTDDKISEYEHDIKRTAEFIRVLKNIEKSLDKFGY